MTDPASAIAGNASLNTWTDLSGFNQLRAEAKQDGKAALPAVAKQFEALFTQMMLKSMREAGDSLGEGLGDSDAGKAYRDLFDQQLAVSLSQAGNGIGIAQMLVRQLGGKVAGATSATTNGALSMGAGLSTDGGLSAGIDPTTAATIEGVAAPAGAATGADAFSQSLSELVQAGRAVGHSAMKWLPSSAQDFVRELAPYAKAVGQKLGLSMRTVLAQAALETQWGKHMPRAADGSPSFNLFGIKAGSSWDGRKVSVPTLEFEGGVAVQRRAQFRAYDSPAQSFSDYASLIAGNPRYAAVRGHGDDVRGFANALVQGGYATDPGYAEKIAAVASSPVMREALAALKNSVNLPTQ